MNPDPPAPSRPFVEPAASTASERGAGEVPRPPVSPPAPWSFPSGVEGRLSNGVETWVHDMPGQLICSIRVAVPMPTTAEPAGLEGVGTILARTLDEGTARRSADEMAELLERTGCALAAHATDDGLVVDLDVPKRRLRDGLELLVEALAAPAFGAREVERHVRQRLAEIEHDHAQPAAAAALAFLDEYYAEGDRYARPVAGAADSVARLTPDVVAAHHRAHVRPAGAVVALAGDLAGVDTDDLVEATLGAWVAPAQAPDELAPATSAAALRAPGATRIVVVDRPGNVQSELYVASPAPGRDVPGGWAPYPVLAMVLGGAPQARLDAVLREEKGYTYGVRCGFRPRARGGLFVTSGAVRSDATVDALRLAVGILDDARGGFGADETRAAVDFVARTAPARYATADAVAAEVSARRLDGSGGPAHTRAVLADLPNVTAARLAEAYDRIGRERTIVVVGDAASFVDDLAAAGLGEVTVRR